MRFPLSCFLFLFFTTAFSQETGAPIVVAEIKIDSLYREDQFYVGITYNTLADKTAGLTQSKFSAGFTAGFLRDMPINKSRTIAIAPGIGFSYTNYNQNLMITGTSQSAIYSTINSEDQYSKNKFSYLSVDVPIELRWRSSTFESHKFWRVYTGVKLSYLLYDKSVFNSEKTNITIKGNDDFNQFQYGAYVSAGYNTINLYAYYGLNPLFKSANLDGEKIKIRSLNLGLIFYIL
ncbi:hypothetical protein RCH18_000170 [Flavobacterium sp. PL11]|jgi:hypothetical protein|uniref:porin family protein n=1 Tax=Flavobacterium sp. PL11 TaxID=3071717 RepID=UPI002DF7B4B4|nr:hypothetical protein [Flavobacterium sp. PL11]